MQGGSHGEIYCVLRYFRLKSKSEDRPAPIGVLTGEQLARDSSQEITIRQINNLPEKTRQRIYRGLLSPEIMVRFRIDPLTWESKHGCFQLFFKAEPETGVVNIAITDQTNVQDELLSIELQDNAFNGIDLNLIVLGDPDSPRFGVDRDRADQPTMFGTLRRNHDEEKRAMEAGLAPGQVRQGLGSSKIILNQVETFLAALGQRAYFLEPLSYVSAWIFERRGFAYVRGHKLMAQINREFLPGGALHHALDGSTPFRQPHQSNTVRGRAWAIHDGILEAIDTRWDELRMIKQIGQHASVETFPGAVY